MTTDEEAAVCQTVMVDGDPILVRVTSLLTPDEVEAFAWVVRAARRKYAAEQAAADAALDQAEQTGGAHTRHGGEG